MTKLKGLWYRFVSWLIYPVVQKEIDRVYNEVLVPKMNGYLDRVENALNQLDRSNVEHHANVLLVQREHNQRMAGLSERECAAFEKIADMMAARRPGRPRKIPRENKES